MSPTLSRLKTYLTVNDVETGKSEAYPELEPLKLDAPFEDAFDRAVEVVRSLPRWKLVRADREQGVIHAQVRTRFFWFVDDFYLKITKGTPVVVSARSRSRIGRGDFGKNAWNIELFLSHLKSRFVAP